MTPPYTHTPGPWHITPDGIVAGDPTARRKAWIVSGIAAGPHAIGNMHLIATAPALLAVAQAALDYLTDHAIDLEGEPEEILAGLRLDLDDAILAAQGGAP